MAAAEEYRQAGLYDPDMPQAAERLALLELLAERGVTLIEMAEAEAEGRLVGLAVDTVVRLPGERFTFEDACARAGIDVALGGTLVRAAGFAQPDPGERVFTDADAGALRFLGTLAGVHERMALQITRAAGAAMATLAEAELAAIRSAFEGPMRAAGVGEHTQAQSFMGIAGVLPEMHELLDVLHRRHLLAGMRTEVLWDERGGHHVDLAIGFADLVGYTTRTHALDREDLAGIIAHFEQTAASVIAEGRGRLVKLIGDEIMFRAGGAADACAIARSLLDAFAADPALPELRIGLCAGPVLPFEGDFYGPAVNVAARLVKEAEPGTALACAAFAERGGDGCTFDPAGRRTLKGVGEVDTVWVLPLPSRPPD